MGGTIAGDLKLDEMVHSSTMVTVARFGPAFEEECQALMMQCIHDVKKRDFSPEQDDDMLDLAKYYDADAGSLLLVVLAPIVDEQRHKVVGTLGLKNNGIIEGKKTGTLRRLYLEKAHRADALLPLFHAMRSFVIMQRFQRLQFIARQKMGSIFETYKGIAKHLGMAQTTLDEESILYTWNLPEQNGEVPGKLFSCLGKR